jgi:hypothetical protein
MCGREALDRLGAFRLIYLALRVLRESALPIALVASYICMNLHISVYRFIQMVQMNELGRSSISVSIRYKTALFVPLSR